MPALTITDLNNAKLDLDHWAEVATSLNPTATDRLGHVKQTISAAGNVIAQTAAGQATTARIAAEAARDAANAVGKVFTTTELGIVGTTSGQSFSVLSADLQDIIIYTNPSTTEVFRLKTKAFFDSLGIFTNYSSRVGYAYAWLDATSALALGITNEGRIIFGSGGDIDARVDAAEAALLGSPTQSDPSYNRSGYLWAFEDSNGNVAGGIDAAGNLISKGINLTTQVVDQAAEIALNTAARKFITPSGFWWYGDSLSASGAPAWLAGYLGKPVTAGAVGGQTAQQVAARFGGQVPMFTVTGNTIPATGAVAVTSRSIDPITTSGGGPITGKLAGIAGTYTSDGSTYWTFTRTTAGTALVIDPATPFLIDFTNDRLFGTVIFWYGRNNVGTGTFNADVKQAIADSIAKLKTQDQRFVVLSVLNWPGETTGTSRWTDIETLNTDLKTLYPNNFVDVLNLLRRSGDGSANDIADTDSGIIPRSLRNPADGHLNNTTGNPVVATRVFQFLTEKGWLA